MNVPKENGRAARPNNQGARNHNKKQHHLQRSVNTNSSPNINAKKYDNQTSYPHTDKERLMNQKKHFKKPPKISKKFPGVFGTLTSPPLPKKKRNFRKKQAGYNDD